VLNPGDAVDRYEILEFLGEGGMGSVYRAHDTRLQRDIALKILRKEAGPVDGASAPAGAARLLREARAVALLEHPNVVAVYDVGEVETPAALKGTTYLAMELVNGRSLREYLVDWPVPIAERVRWLSDIARALGAAHARGLVHRDVKPENVMVRRDGVVKVLDFGIAKRGPSPGARARTRSGVTHHPSTITSNGFIVGTPQYMAPEQMRGEAIDGRADQFSWGVVAYELLCSEPPWHPEEGDTLQLVAQVLSMDPEPLVLHNPEVPRAVADVVMRALAKSPGDRFASMDDVVAALAAGGADETPRPFTVRANPEARTLSAHPTVEPAKAPATAPAPSPTPAPRRRLLRAVAATATLCAVVALSGYGARKVAAPGAVARASLATVSVSGAQSPRPGCASNRECTQAHGGEAYLCRKDDGQCVALASPDCRVLAEPRDLDNDDTVWLGSLYPLTGPDAAAFGVVESQAVDLARQDFAQTMAGMTTQRARGVVHPIGLLSCDDAVDPARAARHLALDVKVPAVIGFRSGAEAVELATSTFLPNGVMTVSALNTSPQIATIPQPPGPRLVWRTTYNMAETAAPLSLLVSSVLEPRVKAQGLGGALRVALVRPKNTGALGFSTALFDKLTFNGKSALDNGTDYREMVYADGAARDASLGEIAGSLEKFAPHVVVFQGDDAIVKLAFEPLEARWPASRRYRPTYLTMTVLTPEVFRFAGSDPSRRRRFFGLTTVSTTPTNARFVMHYNEAFREKITRTISPNSSYDAFYVLAYATHALGDAPITGTSLASAIPRLLPPGKSIEVGPPGIFEAFTTLRSGQNVDLLGATGKLDFDLTTGDPPVDQAVLCVAVDESKRAFDSVESGLVYRASTAKLEGTLRCP
jgi:serine/threonine protein kinase